MVGLLSPPLEPGICDQIRSDRHLKWLLRHLEQRDSGLREQRSEKTVKLFGLCKRPVIERSQQKVVRLIIPKDAVQGGGLLDRLKNRAIPRRPEMITHERAVREVRHVGVTQRIESIVAAPIAIQPVIRGI